jgi:hypothetical protein
MLLVHKMSALFDEGSAKGELYGWQAYKAGLC